LRASIVDRDADRSGAAAGALAGLSFQSANRLYSMASVALIWSPKTRAYVSGVIRVNALRGGVGAQRGEFLLDAAWILDGAVSTPLEGRHRFGQLQPLCGGIGQLRQRA